MRITGIPATFPQTAEPSAIQARALQLIAELPIAKQLAARHLYCARNPAISQFLASCID